MRLQSESERKKGIYYDVDTSCSVGKGGMGQVFRGLQINEKAGKRMDAAVKFLFNDLPQKAIDRARREAAIRVKHENLLQMYDFIEIEETAEGRQPVMHYHVASEWINGVSLFDLIHGKTTNQFNEELPKLKQLYRLYREDRASFAKSIILGILKGIEALHEKGYIHRDLDPSNIMITEEGIVKIVDYGIAKKLTAINTQDQELTETGQFIGKPAYAAPELVLGDSKNQNQTTDIYAIGIILFQLITGRLPFEGNMSELVKQQIHSNVPLKYIPYLSLRKIIKKATSKKQEDRYASAKDMLRSIEEAESKNNVWQYLRTYWLYALMGILVGTAILVVLLLFLL